MRRRIDPVLGNPASDLGNAALVFRLTAPVRGKSSLVFRLTAFLLGKSRAMLGSIAPVLDKSRRVFRLNKAASPHPTSIMIRELFSGTLMFEETE